MTAGGRPSVVSEAARERIRALREQGLSVRAIAAEVGLSRSVVGREVSAIGRTGAEAEVEEPSPPAAVDLGPWGVVPVDADGRVRCLRCHEWLPVETVREHLFGTVSGRIRDLTPEELDDAAWAAPARLDPVTAIWW